ncbi:glycosyltransferase family 4 protein [Chromobacterium paludis]|uniref:Glycosyltransferase family 4 protein n=2 Tax=Chromobacterium paludis TaxID=2605945 RepID=A0A5C1DJ85_9NEIS|nr:glycosyltransferase family 4 protein [Chromobacterium paludis]QEL56754.1 glycosyltransferase family 4 protein [Chromobacterium paludis]
MQQMQWLSRAGYQTALACRLGSRVESVAKGKGLTTLPVRFRNSAHVPSILALVRWLRAHRLALAICHSGHDSNNLALAARLSGHRPFLLRSRTYLPAGHSSLPYNWLADATMLPSDYLRRQLLQNPSIRPEKLHVVYPGIDFAALDAAQDAALPGALTAWLAAGQGPVVAHAAMLRGEKGHALMLEAMARLSARWPELRYVMAGEGGERERLQAMARQLGLEARVCFAGLLPSVAPLLKRADLLVMPSSYEPLGMSQIEALALGVPVLASDTGGIPETVRDGETGVLLPPGDVAAWTRALDEALSAPARMLALAEAGRRDVRERFAPENNLRTVLRLAGLPDDLDVA